MDKAIFHKPLLRGPRQEVYQDVVMEALVNGYVDPKEVIQEVTFKLAIQEGVFKLGSSEWVKDNIRGQIEGITSHIVDLTKPRGLEAFKEKYGEYSLQAVPAPQFIFKHNLRPRINKELVGSIEGDMPYQYNTSISVPVYVVYAPDRDANGWTDNRTGEIYINLHKLPSSGTIIRDALVHEYTHLLDPKHYQFLNNRSRKKYISPDPADLAASSARYAKQPMEFDAESSAMIENMRRTIVNTKGKDEKMSLIREVRDHLRSPSNDDLPYEFFKGRSFAQENPFYALWTTKPALIKLFNKRLLFMLSELESKIMSGALK